jgi:hypothetical protein
VVRVLVDELVCLQESKLSVISWKERIARLIQAGASRLGCLRHE